MTKCRKCGAENATGAKFCQMCANPLGGGESTSSSSNSSLSTTKIFSLEPSELQICPVCDAPNEGGWAFCQQCGSKLGGSSALDEVSEADQEEPQQTYATTIHSSQLVDELKKAAAHGGITCPKCKQSLVAGAVFCHKCGASISTTKTIAMSSFRAAPKARLHLIVDGEETGEEFEVKGDAVVGRIHGDITFPHDDYMSGTHARIVRRGDKFMLIDEDSRNGSFIRIRKEVEIKSGDFILLGKQLFRFEI